MRHVPDPVEQFMKRWQAHEGGAEMASCCTFASRETLKAALNGLASSE